MARTAGASGQGSTAEPGAAGASAPGVDADDPFGLVAWMKDNMPGAPIHPLMAHPTAAMAAATALGFGMTSHVAGIMFGAMQGAMETLKKGSSGLDTTKPESAVEASEPVKNAEPVEKVTMTARRSAPRAKAKPVAVQTVAADDIKAISGIGPKLEQALQQLGIATLADVAGLSAKRVTKLDEQLGLGGRISRDDWVGQAKGLLQG